MPGFALEPHHTVAAKVVHRGRDAANDRLGAGNRSAAPQFQQVAEHPDDQRGENQRDADDECDRNTKARDAAVKHHDGAENESGNATEAQGAEARRKCLCNHQRDADKDERETGIIDRQYLQRVGGKQQADHADHAGDDRARIPAFVHQAVDADESK